MLDARTPAADRRLGDPCRYPVGPIGPRSARKKKRGLFHRTGVVVPALVMAVLLVVGVLVAAKETNTSGSGASGLFQSIDSLGHEQPGDRARERAADDHRDEQRRRDADRGLQARAGGPDPAPGRAAGGQRSRQRRLERLGQRTGTGITGAAPPADPSSAEEIGEAELVDFGFSKSTQWPACTTCGSRRAAGTSTPTTRRPVPTASRSRCPATRWRSVASDWETDPKTQIIWGLGYIKSTYGTPCAAWQNEVDYGYY